MEKVYSVITDRDFEVLQFLWRWKVSTTAALTKKFFTGCNAKTAYNRLNQLEHKGVIQGQADKTGKRFFWTLTLDGYSRVHGYLPDFTEAGYKSEHPGHDLLVSAVNIGEWLLEAPEGASLFSEQELRRLDFEFYPSWVPKIKVHRPDGYWNLKNGDGSTTIALEVELSTKTRASYAEVADFYSRLREINKVIWLVPGRARAKSLSAIFAEHTRTGVNPHQFLSYTNFQTLGWHTPIEFGSSAGTTLFEMLHLGIGNLPAFLGNSGKIGAEPSLVSRLLDVAKSPYKLKTPKIYDVGIFGY